MNIGIFGGSFDPVHRGHEWIVSHALQEGLDQILMIPCLVSPHKLEHSPRASASVRCELLKKVFLGNSQVMIDTWEIDRNQVSYTWETLDYLRAKQPQDQWTLMLGGDQFSVIETWTRAQEWIHQVNFLVFPRRGEKNDFKKQKEAGLHFRVASGFPPEISSTEIRRCILEKRDWEKMVSASVREVIMTQRLYGFSE